MPFDRQRGRFALTLYYVLDAVQEWHNVTAHGVYHLRHSAGGFASAPTVRKAILKTNPSGAAAPAAAGCEARVRFLVRLLA
jgi:hypothetical protein